MAEFNVATIFITTEIREEIQKKNKKMSFRKIFLMEALHFIKLKSLMPFLQAIKLTHATDETEKYPSKLH